MYENHPKKNYGGNNPKSQARPGRGKIEKTFEELALEVKNKYFSKSSEDILRMSQSEGLDLLLNDVELYVKEEAAYISPSQLRNIYGSAMKAQSINELKMLRPKLAYAAGKKREIKSFFAFIDYLIKKVDTLEKLSEFKTFFESVVAYHKRYAKVQ